MPVAGVVAGTSNKTLVVVRPLPGALAAVLRDVVEIFVTLLTPSSRPRVATGAFTIASVGIDFGLGSMIVAVITYCTGSRRLGGDEQRTFVVVRSSDTIHAVVIVVVHQNEN